MGRLIRYIPWQDSVIEVSNKTVRDHYLMRPSPAVNEMIRGVIGRALHLCGYRIKIHAMVFLSNHYHMLLTTPDTKTLSDFMQHVDANIARGLARIHSFDGKVWKGRYSAIPVIGDEAVERRAMYILSNGCKEGLVRRPVDWPGVNCVKALCEGEKITGKWVDRTSYWKQVTHIHRHKNSRNKKGKKHKTHDPDVKLEDFAKEYEVPLTPLPHLANDSEEERQRRFRQMVYDIEAEARSTNALESRKVPGVDKLLNVNIFDSPKKVDKRPRPICHAESFLELLDFKKGYEEFRDQYLSALEAHEMSDPGDELPYPDNCFYSRLKFKPFSEGFDSS